MQDATDKMSRAEQVQVDAALDQAAMRFREIVGAMYGITVER